MKTKVIVVEFRQARNKYEKACCGVTEYDNGVIKVFINSRQSSGEMHNTFFHECAHAYMYMQNCKISDQEQERIARLIGNIVEPCFRKYKK